MATRAEWTDRVKRWEQSGLDAAEFASREGVEAKEFDSWRRQVQAGAGVEPRTLSVRMAEPATAFAPGWIDVELPNGDLVRVLPRVDAVTFACVLAIAAELSAKQGMPAHPRPVAQVASRRGRR